MHIVKVGRRWINLAYLISAERRDGPQDTREAAEGSLHVTLLSGREFVLVPPDCDLLERYLRDAAIPSLEGAAPGSAPVISTALDASTYEPIEGGGRPREREVGGG